MYPFKVRKGNAVSSRRGFLKVPPTEWGEVLQGNIIEYFWNNGEHDGLYIDCGAAYGISTVSMAHKYKKVLAIECEYLNYKVLKENCSYYDNIETLYMAVGDREDSVTVHSYKDSPLLSYVSDEGKTRTERAVYGLRPDRFTDNITMKTIDSLVEPFEKVNAIKIDVEGYELPAVKGAMNTLKNNNILLIVECFKKNHRQEKLIQMMEDIGYRYIESLTKFDIVFTR